MDQSKPVRKIILQLFFYTILYILSGCSSVRKSANNNYATLEASYTSYQSAQGSGRGIIFRVLIPEEIKRDLTVDSFYINKKPLPFTIQERPGGTYLEANYFVSVANPLLNMETKSEQQAITRKVTDPIIMNKEFYPSWILVTHKGVQQKFSIPVYKEEKDPAHEQ